MSPDFIRSTQSSSLTWAKDGIRHRRYFPGCSRHKHTTYPQKSLWFLMMKQPVNKLPRYKQHAEHPTLPYLLSDNFTGSKIQRNVQLQDGHTLRPLSVRVLGTPFVRSWGPFVRVYGPTSLGIQYSHHETATGSHFQIPCHVWTPLAWWLAAWGNYTTRILSSLTSSLPMATVCSSTGYADSLQESPWVIPFLRTISTVLSFFISLTWYKIYGFLICTSSLNQRLTSHFQDLYKTTANCTSSSQNSGLLALMLNFHQLLTCPWLTSHFLEHLRQRPTSHLPDVSLLCTWPSFFSLQLAFCLFFHGQEACCHCPAKSPYCVWRIVYHRSLASMFQEPCPAGSPEDLPHW